MVFGFFKTLFGGGGKVAAKPAVSVPDPRKELLETRERSFRIKDVAHTQASESFARWGRFLGLLVVILTAIVGTSAFAALEGSPSRGAKIAVFVISAVAAIAAAVKEWAGFEDLAKKHASAALALLTLRYKADELLILLLRNGPEADIKKGIEELNADALKVEEPYLPRLYYGRGRKWVDDEILKHTKGGATDVF